MQSGATGAPSGSMTSSDANVNDEAQVRQLAHTVLGTLYNHVEPSDMSNYRDSLQQIQQHFDTTLFTHVVDSISSDDLVKLVDKYQMTMTEKQHMVNVEMISDSADQTQWRVTTDMTLFFIKDQIEIVKPVRNILVIQKTAKATPVYKVVSFDTSDHGRPQMIDHQAIRQSNCPKRPVSDD
ncbi:MAG TPA: hypothetical protein DCW33_00290 [Proteobacteria bacterium]|nr:hypothetical protein [Pseudomonadota bacterium]